MKEQDRTERFLPLKEALAFLNCSQSTIYRWMKEGDGFSKLKAFKVGRGWRFAESDLIAFIKARSNEQKT